MKFRSTRIPGAFVVELESVEDERGFFARSWCSDEFRTNGLNPGLAQCSVSFNRVRGTLRGMHVQIAPHEEAKLVRCTRGSVFDVIADLRPESSVYATWYGIELSAENRLALYVPEGVAHGFQTLEENCEVFYQISERYHEECARGVRWDDSTLSIPWPLPQPTLSARDRRLPSLVDASLGRLKED